MKIVSTLVIFTSFFLFAFQQIAGASSENALGSATTQRETRWGQNSSAELRELLDFYRNEEFATNVWSELHWRSETMLVEVGDDLTGISNDAIKDIFPDPCDRIIDKIATTVRNEVPESLLEGPKDIRAACPQWDRLSESDRKDFYVALVTSMALTESTCNNKAKNRNAPSGTAYGLWQTPKPLSAEKGARWVLDKIESQVNKSGLLFWSNARRNYWAVLNPKIHAHKVKRILRKIPACVVKALAKEP